jgi:predicted HAD superfamily phosphohydrolase
MAETLGSLADKISIIELKRYYMTRQTERQDVNDEHRQSCLKKLKILTEQRDDLVEEIDELFQAVMTSKQQLKVYRQYKMYNDPKYRRRET